MKDADVATVVVVDAITADAADSVVMDSSEEETAAVFGSY